MAESPIVDASPLIVLARAGQLDLLRLLGERVLVPESVVAEVRAHSDDAVRALDVELWIEQVPPRPIPEVIAAWDLGAGESAVLSWAIGHPGSLVVIDDYAARACAAVLGVPVKGTLGLALLAKQRGRIARARPLVDELRGAGLYALRERRPRGTEPRRRVKATRSRRVHARSARKVLAHERRSRR